MNFLVVIPARYRSTRFPGKPLADLAGSPMIEHVWRRCCQAVDAEKVIIATDDKRIQAVAQGFGARVEMTSSDCLTGTDRVAEVAKRYPADWYVNVQGDEPFIDPDEVLAMIAQTGQVKDGISAINAMTPITEERAFRSSNVPKVVTDLNSRLLYISRSPIPTGKALGFDMAYRQVGLYAFRSEVLSLYGDGSPKGTIEQVEDIEILRIIEHGNSVQMICVKSAPMAVDTIEDLHTASLIFEENQKSMRPRPSH